MIFVLLVSGSVFCDLQGFNERTASDVTRISFPEVRLGIIPGAGGTQRAPRLIGMSKAKELIFTGRILTARDAKDLGELVFLK